MLQNKINSLPQENGIYIFKNEFDDIIYIGKAKNLKKRVSQYFQNKNLGVKTEHLVKKIKDLDFIIVNNELEALLLENKLIKKHNPKYNIKLKDDKTYAYLKLTDEKFPKLVMTRRVLSKRKNFLGEIYFGPYADNFQRKILFNLCSELFQILTNKTFTNKTKLNYDIGLAPSKSKKELDENFYKKKVELTINFLKGKNIKEILKNLYSQMKKESEKLNFEFAKKIKDKIIAIERLQEQNSQLVDLQKNNSQDVIVFKEKNNVIKFLILKIKQGTILKKEIYDLKEIDTLKEIMEEFLKIYYKKNPFPNEIIIDKELNNKNDLEKFFEKKYNSKTKILNPKKGKNFELIKLAKKNLESEFDFSIEKNLKEKLNLNFIPKIIECFDMSNLGHKDLVGAMTRFIKQKKDTKNFRRYNIKSFVGKNDDYLSFKEVIFRRFYKNSNLEKEKIKQIAKNIELNFSQSKSEKIELPNLVIVDGGVGQLNVTLEILKLLKLEKKFDLISLAKKEEIIYKYNKDELHQYKLSLKSSEMKYIINIRDSTHKFVISFNRSKRKLK